MTVENTSPSPTRRQYPVTAVFCLLWLSGCSLFGIRTAEEAGYTLVASDGEIELRNYAGYVSVETIVESDFAEAGNQAFRRLFAYISGENRKRVEIAMTAPVTASEAASDGEPIEMTAPVLATRHPRGWRYSFVLPASYTIDNAPLPLRDDVRLVEIEPKRVAVLSFSGSWNQSAFSEKLDRLLGWIEDNRLETISSPRFAGYDPPWTLPFLRRNEILIDVKS